MRILTAGTPGLREPSVEIQTILPAIHSLAEKMIEVIKANKALGIAAPQVGYNLRIIVVNKDLLKVSNWPSLGDYCVFINPVITYKSIHTTTNNEGCLSFPNKRVKLSRPFSIAFTAKDLEGKEYTLTASDLAAACIQHEVDHLDGILINDRQKEQRKG